MREIKRKRKKGRKRKLGKIVKEENEKGSLGKENELKKGIENREQRLRKIRSEKDRDRASNYVS